MEELFRQLCNKRPDFLENLNTFSKEVRQIFLDKITKEKVESNFTSTLAEIDFGLLFIKLGFDIEYDKFYNKQTPDWTISTGSSKAICEVYRLGKSKNDQFKSDFLSKLAQKARELKFKYWVNINAIKILDSDFDVSEENVVSIIQKLENWLSSSKDVGEKLTIEDSFEFILKRIDMNSNHLICTVYRPIEFKPEKLIQFEYLKDDNNITIKLKKYNEIIRECNYPYFIAIALDFTSGFKFEDFDEYFLGSKVGFDCDDTDYETSLEDRDYGTEWTELGIFYNNPQLSGLIILDNNKYHLLLNPIKKQVIYSDRNKQTLNNLIKIYN